jgi:hypothetical protein
MDALRPAVVVGVPALALDERPRAEVARALSAMNIVTDDNPRKGEDSEVMSYPGHLRR